MSSEDTTEHILRLIDEVTEPAKKAEEALQHVEKAAEHAKESTEHASHGLEMLKDVFSKIFGKEFEEGHEKLEKGLEGFKGIGKFLPVAELAVAGGALFAGGKALFEFSEELAKVAAETVVEIAEKTAELAVEAFKFAAEAADERRNTTFALMGVLGSSMGAANEQLEKLEAMAKNMPAGKEAVIAWGTQLLRSNFKEDELKPILGAMSDIVALNGGNKGAADQLESMLIRLQATGKLGSRQLVQLQRIGISPDAIFQQIAAMHHVSVEEAKKLLEKGKINADEATDAILNTIAGKSGGKLGSLGSKLAEGSIGVQLQHIHDSVTNLFEHVDIGPLAAFLGRVNKALSGEAGERFVTIINKCFSTVANLFGSITSDDIESVINGVADAFEKVGEWIEEASDKTAPLRADVVALVEHIENMDPSTLSSLSLAFEVLGNYVDIALGQLDGFVRTLNTLATICDTVHDAMRTGGGSIIDGLWEGIEDRFTALLARFGILMSMLPASVRTVLDSHSPSRVFHSIGMDVSDGMAGGIGAGHARVQREMESLAMPPANMNGRPATLGGMRGGQHVEINLSIDASGHKDPESVVAEIRRLILPELASAVEQLNVEAGAA